LSIKFLRSKNADGDEIYFIDYRVFVKQKRR